MSFTGKATFTAGADLPELMEDVSDVVGIVSPYETPLLDHLGDPRKVATSTVHEWIEDTLLPNTAVLDQSLFTPSPTTATSLTLASATSMRPGDLVQPEGTSEVMLVTAALPGFNALFGTDLGTGLLIHVLNDEGGLVGIYLCHRLGQLLSWHGLDDLVADILMQLRKGLRLKVRAKANHELSAGGLRQML